MVDSILQGGDDLLLARQESHGYAPALQLQLPQVPVIHSARAPV